MIQHGGSIAVKRLMSGRGKAARDKARDTEKVKKEMTETAINGVPKGASTGSNIFIQVRGMGNEKQIQMLQKEAHLQLFHPLFYCRG